MAHLSFFVRASSLSIQAKNGLPGERITSLLEDHVGQLWVGVDNELCIYGDGKFRQIKHPKHSRLGVIAAIAEDRDYTIWAACAKFERSTFCGGNTAESNGLEVQAAVEAWRKTPKVRPKLYAVSVLLQRQTADNVDLLLMTVRRLSCIDCLLL